MSGSEYDLTANYGLKKPWLNQDFDLWGQHWNENADLLDNLVKSQSVAPPRTGMFATATGTTPATATLIFSNYTVFTTVAPGAYARLSAIGPPSYVTELIVLPRGGNNLIVIPDAGGQIESYGVDAPIQIADHGNTTFVCIDPSAPGGRQWYVK